MKPVKISFFFIAVLAIMLLLTVFSQPQKLDGLRQEDGFRIGELLIKYPTFKSFTQPLKINANTKADSTIALINPIIHEKADSIPAPDYSDTDTLRIERISYPTGNENFAAQISALLSEGNCRILHYGDSQLEGDRISGYLRNRFQGIYGGGGPGFIPIKQVYDQLAAEVIGSENWIRLAAFDPTKDRIVGNNYGLYASISRFTPHDPIKVDSLQWDSLGVEKAHIIIKPSLKSYAALRNYKKVGLHYGNLAYPVKINVKSENTILAVGDLIADMAYHCFEIILENNPEEITIELEGKVSPDFYGLTLDSKAGIQLDNIAMRGASGTVFSQLNSESFRAMANKLSPDIVMFQYGGNTIPYMKDSVSIQNYVRYLAGNIKWVERNIKGIKVMFLGPADMSTMINGAMVTYPLLPYLDEQLQQSCFANGWAYWSTFKAMGGQNSMPKWVEQGLASSDYTHFAPQGTRIISELFFTALYLDLAK
ncbi:MAG: hypothetical protein K0B15_09800 [Lentimicrobium sp.]|nr:hypothetical protein [Lentimicrobium sp.]